VIDLVKGGVELEHLKTTFDFLTARLHRINDHHTILTLLQAGIKSDQLVLVTGLILAR